MGSQLGLRRMTRADFELGFPLLRGTNWAIKSRRTRRCNCIAWAAREKHRRWDFGDQDFWPEGVDKEDAIKYLIAAYAKFGFKVCHRDECDKYGGQHDIIVLYELNGEWLHAARMLHNGMWSSKMGDCEDIQHETPEALSGVRYGDPTVFMKRKKGYA